MNRSSLSRRILVILALGCASFIFAPAGRPQENTLRYARQTIDTLTEFDLHALNPSGPLRLFPASVPRTDTGFMHNLKQRRVICVLSGDELQVFEAISPRTLDSILAADIAAVRQKLDDINVLQNRLSRIEREVAERESSLAELFNDLRRQVDKAPDEQLIALYCDTAASALAQMEAKRQLAQLDVDSERHSLLYEMLRLELSALLNTATTQQELTLLTRRDPAALSKQLMELLSGKLKSAANKLQALTDKIAESRLREERLFQEAFAVGEKSDAGTVLKLLADKSITMVDKVYSHPRRFAELIEVEVELAAAAASQAELGAFVVEMNTLSGEMVSRGIRKSAAKHVEVTPREFDTPRLSPQQVRLLAEAADWELVQWTVFLRSLAASYGSPSGLAVSIPPPTGVFIGPRKIRLSPNEVPAFLQAASRLPDNDYDRLAELVELAATEHTKAEAESGEETVFWEFVHYYLQETAHRGLATGGG